jgi:hypothetical protein
MSSDNNDTKEIVDFAGRLRYVLEFKINKLRTIMKKLDNHLEADMAMIRIQSLEWVQGLIQDIILNHVTADWSFYDGSDD